MRLKNVKGAANIIHESTYVIANPLEVRGCYNKIFNNNAPLYIEIGMGKGDFIIEQAKQNPDINFIGVEKFDSVIARAIQKLDNENIPNLRLMRFDATDIDKCFDKEVDKIFLNFSDPWPKKRHIFRRLSSDLFLERYSKIFKGENIVEMKTDNRILFEYSIKSFTDYGYKIDRLSLDLYKDDLTGNVQTEYEKRFVEKGQIIYMIRVTK